MTDVLTRLKGRVPDSLIEEVLFKDAVAEIEQLRTELAEHKRRSSEDQADAANAWAKCQALEYAQALARKLNTGGAA